MSTPLATPDELGVFLGKQIDPDDARATLILQLAHDRCESYVSPVPDAAKGIELAIAGRAYTNVTSAHQVSLGSGGVSFGAQNSQMGIGGLYVSGQEQRDLRRMAGRSGAYGVDLLQDWPPATDTSVTMTDVDISTL